MNSTRADTEVGSLVSNVVIHVRETRCLIAYAHFEVVQHSHVVGCPLNGGDEGGHLGATSDPSEGSFGLVHAGRCIGRCRVRAEPDGRPSHRSDGPHARIGAQARVARA